MNLTDRERELLLTLTHKARLITLDQVKEAWFAEAKTGAKLARVMLTQLTSEGMLAKREVICHPLIALENPVCEWSPGQGVPNFDAVSYALMSRWKLPVKKFTVYHSTKKAAGRMGGFGGDLRRPTQAGHDLHVTQVYLRFLRQFPGAASEWVSEDLLPTNFGEKTPDVVLQNRSGETYKVIEFGGAYDAEKVRKLHRYCHNHSLPYELW